MRKLKRADKAPKFRSSPPARGTLKSTRNLWYVVASLPQARRAAGLDTESERKPGKRNEETIRNSA